MFEAIKQFFSQYWGQIISLIGAVGATALGRIIYNGFKLLANVSALNHKLSSLEKENKSLQNRIDVLEDNIDIKLKQNTEILEKVSKSIMNRKVREELENILPGYKEKEVKPRKPIEVAHEPSKRIKVRKKVKNNAD